ncbi:MAG: alpha/beta fold hydrolase [Bacteroidia bacterium]|nr:alpha/beta fold hydrolase [Bacteroidia bacterium]
MKKVFLSIISFILSTFGMAQDISGSWNGALSVQGTTLRVVFHIEKDGSTYSSKMDSPDQGAFGIPTGTTTFEEGKLSISAPSLGMSYEGTLSESGDKIEGSFKQAGMDLPLELGREEVKVEKKKPEPRPQDPQDFPYEQEEVKFTVNEGGHEMAGTLTYPSDGKFEQVVVLISGSGPQNRNEELGPMNHRPFLVLSDHLTRKGIAVLRYDDRGVAESGGDFKSATSMDFAHDASAAVAYLKGRNDMKGKKIGLMGHSEGGMIAPIVASKNKSVDFIALLAGPGINIPELMLMQSDLINKASGAPDEVRESNNKVLKEIYALMNANQKADGDELKEKMEVILEESYKSLSEEQQAEIGDKESFFATQTNVLLSPWFRYFMAFEPDDFLSKVKCPVLAVNGELDLQVPSKENLEGIKKSLKKAGNKEVVTKEFASLNHLFQKAETGAPSEYAEIEETFNPEALNFISAWVVKQ